MKQRTRFLLCFLSVGLMLAPGVSASTDDDDIYIQKVVTQTRQGLAELAQSNEAKKIADLMATFDKQYVSWDETCGGNPDLKSADDDCKKMAQQMKTTGMKLYGSLAEYLPSIEKQYKRGATQTYDRLYNSGAFQGSADELYKKLLNSNGDALGAQVAEGGDTLPGNGLPPVFIVGGDQKTSGPIDELFEALKHIVPMIDTRLPLEVVAANSYIDMVTKANMAKKLARAFERAKLNMESMVEYESIIANATASVQAMPKILGIQYTGVRLKAKPNRYRIKRSADKNNAPQQPKRRKAPWSRP